MPLSNLYLCFPLLIRPSKGQSNHQEAGTSADEIKIQVGSLNPFISGSNQSVKLPPTSGTQVLYATVADMFPRDILCIFICIYI